MEDALERLATARSHEETDLAEAAIPPLVDLLADAGIAVIVLKGPVTRHRLYASDERRPVADVDLLVDSFVFRRAMRVIRRAGYARVSRIGHSDTFTSPRDDQPDIDLHLTLPFATIPPHRVFVALSGRTTDLEVDGRLVRVLDEPAHAVHLAIHAAMNGFDPQSRTLDEWQRALRGLSTPQRSSAESLVAVLGVRPIWDLALRAIGDDSDLAELASHLPVRGVVNREILVRQLLTPGTPILVKWRGVQRLAAFQMSDNTTNDWMQRHGLARHDPGSWQLRVAKPVRLAEVSIRHATAGLRRRLAPRHTTNTEI